MTKNTRFSPEVRQRAIRMVLESQDEYDSQWAAICSIAPEILETKLPEKEVNRMTKNTRFSPVSSGIRSLQLIQPSGITGELPFTKSARTYSVSSWC
jgi:hypothetical protein